MSPFAGAGPAVIGVTVTIVWPVTVLLSEYEAVTLTVNGGGVDSDIAGRSYVCETVNVEVAPNVEFPSPKSTFADRKFPCAPFVKGHCVVKVTGNGACPPAGEGTTEHVGATCPETAIAIAKGARQEKATIRTTARTKLIAHPGQREISQKRGKALF